MAPRSLVALRTRSCGSVEHAEVSVADASGPIGIDLPNLWLWEMIDEFIYQFQSFCQYKAKPKNKADEEILLLQSPHSDSVQPSDLAQSSLAWRRAVL